MQTTMYSPEQVQAFVDSVEDLPKDAFCVPHGFSCNKFALFGCYSTAKASYKTYALAYIFQLVMNRKKFRQK
jgi:hypothetical protein